MQICSKRKPTKLEIKCSLILGVVDVDALEVFLEHLQPAQAAVGEAPVGSIDSMEGKRPRLVVLASPPA